MMGERSRLAAISLTALAVSWAHAAAAQPTEEGAPSGGERTEAKGRLDLRISETGATISVNGEAVATSPVTTPIELPPGEHRVSVRKAGFEPFERRLTLAAGATLQLAVTLDPATATGRVRVTIEGEQPMRLIIDGKDVGSTPYEGELPAGTHQLKGSSAAGETAARTVEVKPGERTEVKLAAPTTGRLEVRFEDEVGTVYIDGKAVGEGRYSGLLSAGEHELKVIREGYEPYVERVRIEKGDVRVETVRLRKDAAGQLAGSETESDAWAFDGLYGGLQLLGMFEPAGSGSSLDSGCDAIGATSCEDDPPLGGGFGFYLGYAFAPVGLELFVLGAGDVSQPSATFDGSTGAAINPLVATPAREESFLIGRFGGGGALRLRLLWPFDPLRITTALGAGVAYRHLLLARDTVTADGASASASPDGDGYLTAVLSGEVAAQLRLSETASLALGLSLWLEHAGTDVQSERLTNTRLPGTGDGPPRPQATPAYDLATGTQFFLGPFVGLQLGP